MNKKFKNAVANKQIIYVNIPGPIAEALCIEKEEEFEWTIKSKNTLILKRVIPLEIDDRTNIIQIHTDL